VIGAGVNGLASAIHLATKGWSVCVIEAAETAGGAVRTAEITLPGFRHDIAAMNLSMFAGSPFFRRYGEDLFREGLELIAVDRPFASVFRDGTHLGVSTDLDETTSAIAAFSPQDAIAWRNMRDEFRRDAPHIFALLGAPLPSLEAGRALLRAWRAIGVRGLLRVARLVVSSPRGFVARRFREEKLHVALAAWGMHLDFPPDVAGGALFPFLESMASQDFGMSIGRGGADTIIHAMTALLRRKGGTLVLGQRVTEIELDERGRAAGVVLSDGRRFAAKKAVVANLHPRQLFGALLPRAALSDPFRQKVASFRSGPGTMMIHLAMNRPLEWAAGPALGTYAYVHVAPSLQAMAATYTEAMAGLLPAEPMLVVGQPSIFDSTRAPDGKHVLWIQVRVVPAAIRGDVLAEIDACSWEEARAPFTERVLDLLERYAPGVRRHILAHSTLTPSDLERSNPNLVGGDSLGGSHHLDQNFFFRPFPGYSRYRTPLPRLYMCGASTWPGAGTGAGSGFILGRMLSGA